MTSEVFMFKPSDFEQRWVSPHAREEISKLKEQGWLENPPTIHMYHPGTRDNKTVLVSDKRTWENKGYYAEPVYLYTPKEIEPQRFPREEAKKMLAKGGWYESPAHFPGNEEGKLKTLTLKEAS